MTRVNEKEKLRNLAAGCMKDIPGLNDFRLPLKTIPEIEDLCQKLAGDSVLKIDLVK